ncbi:hypothetical protein ACN27E_18350 [Mycobacterium sp. WMMD1722]|uniref:hypothetical protein n=1 Tax=Mycobacterium sp. WMMD1722 TaxID=3404117 RepID=UPI003BF5C97F
MGDEAHIISPSKNGPRGGVDLPDIDIDGYANRILLCKRHHQIIDEQVHEFTVEKLRAMKAKHEEWIRRMLHTIHAEEPIGLRPRFPSCGMLLPRLRTGADAWNAAIESSFYMLNPIDEDEASPEACDAADDFLTSLRGYAEIHDAISDRGFGAVREAQRDLRNSLDHLAQLQLVAFGAQREMLVTGAGREPWPARMAVVVVRPQADLGDDESLPVVFAGPGTS